MVSAALAVCSLALSACANPQHTCAEGLPQMKARLDKVVGYIEHTAVNEFMIDARKQYLEALSEYRSGDYEACNVSLEQAEILLDKAQRVRRELAT